MLNGFQGMFTTMPISGPTINTVLLSPFFITLVYALILLVFIIVSPIRKAVVVAFFVSGLVWAFHADIGWITWLRDDVHTYGGLNTDQKLLKMEVGIYDFARAAREVLKKDYLIFASDDTLKLRFEYFLLPLRKREQSSDIVVLGDNAAQYDQTTRTFTRGTLTIVDVDPILVYARNAYILRKR